MKFKTQNWIFPLIGLILFFGSYEPARTQVFITQTEALRLAFIDADTVLRKTLFLSKDQKRSLEKKARALFASRIISYYVGLKAGKVVGYAFFEKQIVRTKPTIMMVVITPEGKVQSVEVLAFYEPRDYLLAPGWFRRFHGKTLSPDLWPGRGVDAITGATLSVRAFSLMVRRALALFELIGDQAQ